MHLEQDLPLHQAANLGTVPLVQFLIQQGAKRNSRNEYALRCSSDNGFLSIGEYFVSLGADIYVKDEEPLRRTASSEHLPVVQFLHQ